MTPLPSPSHHNPDFLPHRERRDRTKNRVASDDFMLMTSRFYRREKPALFASRLFGDGANPLSIFAETGRRSKLVIVIFRALADKLALRTRGKGFLTTSASARGADLRAPSSSAASSRSLTPFLPSITLSISASRTLRANYAVGALPLLYTIPAIEMDIIEQSRHDFARHDGKSEFTSFTRCLYRGASSTGPMKSGHHATYSTKAARPSAFFDGR